MQTAATTHFSTHCLPADKRGSCWVDVVNRHIINLDCPDEPDTGIDAELDHFDLGDIRFNHIRASSHCVQRSNAHINDDGRESAFMCLILEGNGFACQGIRGSLFNVGDVLIYNTVHPYSLGFPDKTETMVIDLPHTIMKEYFDSWNQKDLIHLDRTLDVGGYSTANLFNIVQSWMQQDSASNEITCHRLLEQLHGLIHQRSLGNNSRSLPRLLQKSKAFINQHLQREDLSADIISQQMHTSSRQLARAFAIEGNSITRYIWNQRLERCRNEILGSSGHKASISEIAFRWGFNHSAHFSRSYKMRFGETPTETRQRVLRG
ncbi:helix-turn-helix domain-containing protein [Parathalassolituus penaei]|uniref:Helix-turn-helix domain-containing protein n=1 Tax=Parathalassolituus penaei TaxID=2997323 RepID=A0A9X3EEW1_9GAMM|nr:helix-turn-helix domain-containing protein [Parathalassolituus penaei]MCY0966302.1 helix-turn-helix domain-containing protein [Parathalassolituus penaei]